jgi:hypothetical protein
VTLVAVPDRRFLLDELIRAKLHHANETGSCYLPATCSAASSMPVTSRVTLRATD